MLGFRHADLNAQDTDDDGESGTSRGVSSPKVMDDMNTMYFNLRRNIVQDVGYFRAPDPRPVRPNNNKFVFLCQTERDDARSEISRCTARFLREKLGVDVFLDEENIKWGDQQDRTLADATYACSHAIPILSSSFRSRRYCVVELNTFMHRFRNEDGIVVLPVLWGIDSDVLDGYAADVADIAWAAGPRNRPVDFLVDVLWPRLAEQFGGEDLTREELLSLWSDYVDQDSHPNPGRLRRCLIIIVVFAAVFLLATAAIFLGVYFSMIAPSSNTPSNKVPTPRPSATPPSDATISTPSSVTSPQETQPPSGSPEKSPTLPPIMSATPTSSQTQHPSDEPTVIGSPTEPPSLNPSKIPTSSTRPSAAPSLNPSLIPTQTQNPSDDLPATADFDTAGNLYGTFSGRVWTLPSVSTYRIVATYTEDGIRVDYPSRSCGNADPIVPSMIRKNHLQWTEKIDYGTCTNGTFYDLAVPAAGDSWQISGFANNGTLVGLSMSFECRNEC